MSDLAALLLHPVMDGYRDAHLAYSKRGGPNVDQSPYWVQVAESIAARLIAAGVTLAPTPPDALRLIAARRTGLRRASTVTETAAGTFDRRLGARDE